MAESLPALTHIILTPKPCHLINQLILSQIIDFKVLFYLFLYIRCLLFFFDKLFKFKLKVYLLLYIFKMANFIIVNNFGLILIHEYLSLRKDWMNFPFLKCRILIRSLILSNFHQKLWYFTLIYSTRLLWTFLSIRANIISLNNFAILLLLIHFINDVFKLIFF